MPRSFGRRSLGVATRRRMWSGLASYTARRRRPLSTIINFHLYIRFWKHGGFTVQTNFKRLPTVLRQRLWTIYFKNEERTKVQMGSLGSYSHENFTRKRGMCYGNSVNQSVSLSVCISPSHTFRQGCPTGGPRAASGPRPLLIRPATTLQRTLFTNLCFTVIFCLLYVVNKLKICWTQPVVCKYS